MSDESEQYAVLPRGHTFTVGERGVVRDQEADRWSPMDLAQALEWWLKHAALNRWPMRDGRGLKIVSASALRELQTAMDAYRGTQS